MRTAKQVATEKATRAEMARIESDALRQRALVAMTACRAEIDRLISIAERDAPPQILDTIAIDRMISDARRVWDDWVLKRDDVLWKEAGKAERAGNRPHFAIVHPAEERKCDICYIPIDSVMARCDTCRELVAANIQAGMKLPEAVSAVRMDRELAKVTDIVVMRG